MRISKEIRQNGSIRTTNETKQKRSARQPQYYTQEQIDICLCCTNEKCIGTCKKIRRKRNGNQI